MGIKANNNVGRFTIKSYDNYLYTWSPETPTYDKNRNKNTIDKKYYCDAIPGSQGQDWITTYSYNIAISQNGEQQRIAYVACDYVQ